MSAAAKKAAAHDSFAIIGEVSDENTAFAIIAAPVKKLGNLLFKP
jgi:hypothetical protein